MICRSCSTTANDANGALKHARLSRCDKRCRPRRRDGRRSVGDGSATTVLRTHHCRGLCRGELAELRQPLGESSPARSRRTHETSRCARPRSASPCRVSPAAQARQVRVRDTARPQARAPGRRRGSADGAGTSAPCGRRPPARSRARPAAPRTHRAPCVECPTVHTFIADCRLFGPGPVRGGSPRSPSTGRAPCRPASGGLAWDLARGDLRDRTAHRLLRLTVIAWPWWVICSGGPSSSE